MAEDDQSSVDYDVMLEFHEAMEEWQSRNMPLDPSMRPEVAQGVQIHPPTASLATGSSYAGRASMISFENSQGDVLSQQASSHTSLPSAGLSQDHPKSYYPASNRKPRQIGHPTTEIVLAEINNGIRSEQEPRSQAHFRDDALTVKREAALACQTQVPAYAEAPAEHRTVMVGSKRQLSGDTSSAPPKRMQYDGKKPMVLAATRDRIEASTTSSLPAQGASAIAQGQVLEADKLELKLGLRRALAEWSMGVESMTEGLLNILTACMDGLADQLYTLYRGNLATHDLITQHFHEDPVPPPVCRAGDPGKQDRAAHDFADVEAFSTQCEKTPCSARIKNHGKRFSCKACGAGANNFQEFHRHSEGRYPRTFYRCKHCKKIWSRHIHEHCRTVHKKDARLASYKIIWDPFWRGRCQYCNASFSGQRLETTTNLSRHIWENHIVPDYYPNQPTVDHDHDPDDHDADDHDDNGDGDADGSFDDSFGQDFIDFNAYHTGTERSNSGCGHKGHGSQASTSGHRFYSEGTERSKSNKSDRGRTGLIRTSVLRSPRISLPSRGASFNDDDNFHLDLAIIRASAYSGDHGAAKQDQYIKPKNVSFDDAPATNVARSYTLDSEASSIGPVTRTGTMWSDASGTAGRDSDSQSEDESDVECGDSFEPVFETDDLETPRPSTDSPKIVNVGEHGWSYTERMEKLRGETPSEMSEAMTRLRIREVSRLNRDESGALQSR